MTGNPSIERLWGDLNFRVADQPRTTPFLDRTEVVRNSSRLVREKTRARLLQSSSVHQLRVSSLGKLKSSTSFLTRSFWRRGGNRLVLVSSAIPWRLAQNSSDITSGFELCP